MKTKTCLTKDQNTSKKLTKCVWKMTKIRKACNTACRDFCFGLLWYIDVMYRHIKIRNTNGCYWILRSVEHPSCKNPILGEKMLKQKFFGISWLERCSNTNFHRTYNISRESLTSKTRGALPDHNSFLIFRKILLMNQQERTKFFKISKAWGCNRTPVFIELIIFLYIFEES